MRKSGRFEHVRVYRWNGWPRAAVVSEKDAHCYTVMFDVKAFGTLAAARAYIRQIKDRDPLAETTVAAQGLEP